MKLIQSMKLKHEDAFDVSDVGVSAGSEWEREMGSYDVDGQNGGIF